MENKEIGAVEKEEDDEENEEIQLSLYDKPQYNIISTCEAFE